MNKHLLTLALALVMAAAAVGARAEGVPWRDHAPPFDFLFGNHIDTHQQSSLTGNGEIQGFFYLHFTGRTVNGLPEAVHGQESVGWIIEGKPVIARVLALSPLTWCVDRNEFPAEPGYSHFHWLGDPADIGGLMIGDTHQGYLLKLTATRSFFFAGHGGVAVRPGVDAQSHQNVVSDCL